MNRAMPPLHALRAFEAAGRLASFARAAEELNVTPAAISHQVRALEAFFGVRLFRRTTRRVALTEEGQLALGYFRDAFEKLGRGVELLRSRHSSGVLTLTTTPSFASKWLMPRLDAFSRAHPDIDIRLSASTRLADFAREPFDAAIRFGAGRYPRLAQDRLFGESLTPMASPRLLGTRRPRHARELLQLPLLHDDSVQMTGRQPGWAEWFAAAGVADADTARGAHFDDGQLVLQAALAGRGVALGRRVLAFAELAQGSLVAPFDVTLPLDVSYWLVYPSARMQQPTFAAFREWLLAEAGTFVRAMEKAGRGRGRRK